MKKFFALVFILAFGLSSAAAAEEAAPAAGSTSVGAIDQTQAPAAETRVSKDKKVNQVKKTKKIKKLKIAKTKPEATPAQQSALHDRLKMLSAVKN